MRRIRHGEYAWVSHGLVEKKGAEASEDEEEERRRRRRVDGPDDDNDDDDAAADATGRAGEGWSGGITCAGVSGLRRLRRRK